MLPNVKFQMLPKIEHQEETLEQHKTVQLEENQPGQQESKRIKTENDSDDDWVGAIDLDKVINAYQISVKKNKGSAICIS